MTLSVKNIRVEVGPIPKKKKKDIIYFSNFNEMNKVLTSNRIMLLDIIKQEKPESIYKLAILANRDQGNVTKDANILHEYGFIDIVEKKDGERTRSEPQLQSEGIEMVIKFGAGVFGLAKDALEQVSEEFKDEKLKENKRYVEKKYKEALKPVRKTVRKIMKDIEEDD